MTFTPWRTGSRTLGHAARHGDVLFFFGLGDVDSGALAHAFPNLGFARVHQVHGDAVVRADAVTVARADAHYTDAPNVAPVIVTADCVPVLLASRTRVAAVHAGWRGVEANVIGRAAAAFDDAITVAAIGPHLAARSFEVGRDVAARLNAARPDAAVSFERPHDDPLKVHYDLTGLARAQIVAAAGGAVHVSEFTPDTKTSAEYHSYRRDGARSGRNLSFVVRIA